MHDWGLVLQKVLSMQFQHYTKNRLSSVVDPGFDLRGGVDFVNGGRKSLKVLTVEELVILSVSLPYFY